MSENPFKLARTKYNQHGWQSIKDVQENGGFTHTLIEDLESSLKRKRQTGYLTVAEIAKYYGVSTDYLSGLSLVPTTDKDLAYICDYTGFSQETIEVLHNWGKNKSAGSNYRSNDVESFTFPDFLGSIIEKNLTLFLAIESNLKEATALDSTINDSEFQDAMEFWLSPQGKEIESELSKHKLTSVSMSRQKENCIIAATNYFRQAIELYINTRSEILKSTQESEEKSCG